MGATVPSYFLFYLTERSFRPYDGRLNILSKDMDLAENGINRKNFIKGRGAKILEKSIL
jgi:hypothetical protein